MFYGPRARITRPKKMFCFSGTAASGVKFNWHTIKRNKSIFNLKLIITSLFKSCTIDIKKMKYLFILQKKNSWEPNLLIFFFWPKSYISEIKKSLIVSCKDSFFISIYQDKGQMETDLILRSRNQIEPPAAGPSLTSVGSTSSLRTSPQVPPKAPKQSSKNKLIRIPHSPSMRKKGKGIGRFGLVL